MSGAGSQPPPRYLIAGLGGYAGAHHEALLALESRGLARVVATCDPASERFAEQRARWRFAERGVRVFADYDAMLAACAGEADVVVIPTPIHLHAPMHRAAVAAGLAVYLEKPPTLDPEELEAMIATDAAARHATLVGFNFMAEPARLALKERVLRGDFGAPREVRVLAWWPRREGYFRRNAWAGRLLTPEGRPLLDSCLGNAMGHFAHNALHWAGLKRVADWAEPAAVRAQLARAHEIEGADTFLVEARTPAGLRLRLAFTHACVGAARQEETIRCEKATLRIASGGAVEIAWNDGRREHENWPPFEPLPANHLAYSRFWREGGSPATRLVDSRPFVWLNALAHLSPERIGNLAADRRRWIETKAPDGSADRQIEVTGLAAAMEEFLVHGKWLPAALCPGASPGAAVEAEHLPGLAAALHALRGDQKAAL